MEDETTYLCPFCGEEIVTPVDVTQGDYQEYVEDCPVCCSPVILRIEFLADGGIRCQAVPE